MRTRLGTRIETKWWAEAGLNRRHQDFQFASSVARIAHVLYGCTSKETLLSLRFVALNRRPLRRVTATSSCDTVRLFVQDIRDLHGGPTIRPQQLKRAVSFYEEKAVQMLKP